VNGLVEVPAGDPRLVAMHAASVAEMTALYVDDDGNDDEPPHPVVDGARNLLLLADDGEPLACGSLAPLHWPDAPARTGEIKRVYVVPRFRGAGHARTVMRSLLELAREVGYERLWLETGDPQVGAVALYESSGWVRIPAYGQYADDPRTRCYELVL